MIGADEKLRGKRRCVAQLEAPAIDDNESSQFAGLVADAGEGFGSRQKNSADEHGQADDGRNVTAPGAQRDDDQCDAGNRQENAKEHPRARVAAQMQHLGDKQYQDEQTSDRKMAELLAETVWGKRGSGGRAHL